MPESMRVEEGKHPGWGGGHVREPLEKAGGQAPLTSVVRAPLRCAFAARSCCLATEGMKTKPQWRV